jgi:hypothetical protein
MNSNVSETEVMEVLRAIERGSVLLRPKRDPQDIYAGDVLYTASNGWRITIFNDANEWDYIDHIETSDGRTLDFDAIDQMPRVREYEPSEDVAWSRYGIPGYCIFRCTSCGARLTSGPYRAPFLCSSCQSKPQ